MLVLAAALACSRELPHDDFPGMRLLAQVESRLADEEAELKPMLEHYGLVFPVSQADLDEFMQYVHIQGSGADLALGDAFGVESHGGGYLRLLFDHWRPALRVPTLDDHYRFAADGRDLERWQQPAGPLQLIDSDAYKFLRLLIELEPDASKTWTNRQGQQLSVDSLMRRVRESYLTSRPSAAGPLDHSSLHLVELLVAYGKKSPATDFAPIREHLLAVELAQQGLAPEVAATLRAHHAESLGYMLTAPGLAWGEVEQERVKSWLRELEEKHFPDAPDEVEPLSHLGKGLRLVRDQRAVLE